MNPKNPANRDHAQASLSSHFEDALLAAYSSLFGNFDEDAGRYLIFGVDGYTGQSTDDLEEAKKMAVDEADIEGQRIGEVVDNETGQVHFEAYPKEEC